MHANVSKPLIFVVILVLVVALIYSSFTPFNVFAAPNVAPSNADCKEYTTSAGDHNRECCWTETDPGDPEGIELYYCQTCSQTTGDCFEKRPASQGPTSPPSGPVAPLQGGVLEQPPTPQPFDPTAPQQGGVLEQQQTPPTFAPGDSPGVLEQLPPTRTEETQPATEQSVPVCQEGLEFNEDLGFCVPIECPEGQVLNEETGICVLEEQPAAAAEEPEEQPTEEPINEEEQPSEEPGSEEDNSNN